MRDFEELDEVSRKALQECYDEYYMIPFITRVIETSEKFGALKWRVETNRGEVQFRIRNRHSDIKQMYGTNRILVRDSNDNRYEIPDVTKLDAKSKKILFGYL